MKERVVRKYPSTRAKIKIQEQQQRLQKKIHAFNKKADIFLGHLGSRAEQEYLGVDSDLDCDGDVGWEVIDDDLMSDEGGEEEDEYEDEEAVDQAADKVILLMPSSLGAKQCRKHEKTSNLMLQEIELRKGQANDALENLRMSLANKAMLYRSQIRAAKSQRMETRAWTAVNLATTSINKHVRTYRRAYRALQNLEADLTDYDEINEKDLSLSGDIMEESRIGQKSDQLPWFWRLGQMGSKEQESDWMQECESPSQYNAGK
jgi:hypothetical protein